MPADLPPPAYDPTSHDDSDPGGDVLPEYNITPPTTFKIGSVTTPAPLVSLTQMKGHLALLHAFAQLRKEIEERDLSSVGGKWVEAVPKEADRKWAWFVALAVERFDRWCLELRADDEKRNTDAIIPPLDVVMVWHAYMLNPRWYMEDTMRIPHCKLLKSIQGSFQQLLDDPASVGLLLRDPSPERIKLWTERTALPFDYVECIQVLTTTTVFCPSCGRPITVDLIHLDGGGYFQKQFSKACNMPDCPMVPITKETLALQKLCGDLCVPFDVNNPASYLPGTLFPASTADADKTRRLKASFIDSATTLAATHFSLNAYEYQSEAYKSKLLLGMIMYAGTLVSVRARMAIYCGLMLNARVMSAYSDDKAYSVELVGAVLRQGTFVEKMHELKWTEPSYFRGTVDELALHHSGARYHAFLDLMSTSVGSFFVPTLDIDLVWHTHQLNPAKYREDCEMYLKRFIDHDDKIEGLRLSSAFDLTCTAWKSRFGVPYTYCGCPLPGDTIGQRLSRLVGRYTAPLTSPSSSSSTSASTSPPMYPSDSKSDSKSDVKTPSQLPTHAHVHIINPPPNRADILSATHPSDHNAVRFDPGPSAAAHKRVAKQYEQLAKAKLKAREKAAKKAMKKLGLASGVGVAEVKGAGAAATVTGAGTSTLTSAGTGAGAGVVGAGAVGMLPPHLLTPEERRRRNERSADPYGSSLYYTAFLVPVPLFYTPFYGTGAVGAGCVSSAGMVSSTGGCSGFSSGTCGGGGLSSAGGGGSACSGGGGSGNGGCGGGGGGGCGGGGCGGGCGGG